LKLHDADEQTNMCQSNSFKNDVCHPGDAPMTRTSCE
jgi:hypothetical protein